MLFHEVLAAHRDDIMKRWRDLVHGTLIPLSVPSLELTDHIPKFLDEIVSALRNDAGLPGGGPSPDESRTAAGHGEQRLRLGFSLDSVVHEYGALRDAIIAAARSAGAEMTLRQLQVIFDCIVTGIAHAVSEYSRQRDAELARQSNEHFSFIAHELRNPLASAATAFELLRVSLPEGRPAQALSQGLARARELIDQTLQTARVASGIELKRQPTTLAALFEDIEVTAAPEAEAKGIAVHSEIEKDVALDVDRRLLRSALGNLLNNAVKYTPRGGSVALRGKIVAAHLLIEIEDSCGGLAAGKVEAAFAPFVRLSSQESGFGLGLAIAKQAVDAHGGSIRVQNLPGKGCIFAVELALPET